MILRLIRKYYPEGSNGQLMVGEKKIAETIELPWLDNNPGISCIPEGCYQLEIRETKVRGRHLWVKDVPGRKFILVHPANDAKTELSGCIAPVTRTTAAGKGIFSRKAMDKILALVENQSEITLKIES